MLERLTAILKNTREITGFKISAVEEETEEFFLIGKELDMDRGKRVRHFLMTVYRDFEANGVRYKGSASARIHPTMNEAEIRRSVAETAYAAGLVKNPFYPLARPAAGNVSAPSWRDVGKPVSRGFVALAEVLFPQDGTDAAELNSTEIFLTRSATRVINSEGVDLRQRSYRGQVELITVARNAGHEVELYRDLKFAELNPETFRAKVGEMRRLAREKARAVPTPALRKHTVLLSGEPVKEFFQYYYVQTAAKSAYEGISAAKPGQSVQGETVRGDALRMELDPGLTGSVESAAFDEDGFLLEKVEIIRDGRFLRYWGNQQYCHYMEAVPTGSIKNVVIAGGERTAAVLKAGPHLELLAFSDFQMDPVTGDFGGEIRLGRYFDGVQTIPVAGGSISGNIRTVQKEMYFSRELQYENNFVGPATVKLLNVAVTGAEEN
ncbi:MAG: metallopeptidase TldD-related protein [Bacillota bacterium]|jgi:predicted Zn-dependent protease